jgi:hypothetical protein
LRIRIVIVDLGIGIGRIVVLRIVPVIGIVPVRRIPCVRIIIAVVAPRIIAKAEAEEGVMMMAIMVSMVKIAAVVEVIAAMMESTAG